MSSLVAHGGSAWLLAVELVVWLLANSAAVTPTNAAATNAIAAMDRMIFVFMFFHLNLYYGLRLV